MGKYEDMLIEHDYIEVIECDNLPKRLSGLWLGDMILINRNLPITSKLETLAEELAHNELTYGNIIDQSSFNHRKFEGYARKLAYEKLVPLKDIVKAFLQGIHNLYELANFLSYKVLNIINKNMVIPLGAVNMLSSSSHYECLNIKMYSKGEM